MSIKLVVNSKDILKAVQTVGAIVKGNHALPILDNILIELQNNKLVFISDNLEIRSKVELPIESKEEFKTCVPYKLVFNILKGFPSTPIELVLEKMNLKILSETGTYIVPLVDTKEFPESKEKTTTDTVKMESSQLIDAIKKALLFTDKTNATNLHNVLISIKKDGTKIVSTDGNVILEYSMTAGGDEKDLIISRSIASHLIQILSSHEEVELSYSDSHLFIATEGKEINAILSNSTFPPYLRIFEAYSPDKKLTIDNGIIAPAIKRLYALTDQNNQTVKFSIKENIVELSFNNQLQKYEAKETLPCEYTDEEINIAFNANYINNMLTAIEESIEMNITDGSKPCIFIAENIRAIVGPINVN
ncbi:DNA polymerase III subunit beta [Flavobacterium sp. UMI-01]|uniref:DNA polymerase III subunit beta n=1 Tax=Flavobacterium sp. UMI-01 TaxID=1441053 RepID=UPI001C7DEECF|nr:DNA polymerase III subunit beta [Flavobacterium sp. UMI-01]GIZ08342.1 DNA polymerase III subunit beta [Flavobacterium sp. UMI-01]